MAQTAVAEYRRGEMDVQAHVATYKGFETLYKWGSLIIGDFVLFLSIWLCAHAGFFPAAVIGVIVLALGVFALTRKKVEDVDVEVPTH